MVEIEFDGEALEAAKKHESILLDAMSSIGIVKVKDRVFLMEEIKALTNDDLLKDAPNPVSA